MARGEWGLTLLVGFAPHLVELAEEIISRDERTASNLLCAYCKMNCSIFVTMNVVKVNLVS